MREQQESRKRSSDRPAESMACSKPKAEPSFRLSTDSAKFTSRGAPRHLGQPIRKADKQHCHHAVVIANIGFATLASV